jgi:hypothetical protein
MVNRPSPVDITILPELRAFLEEVDILTRGVEAGEYKLSEPEDCLVSGDITWSRLGISCPGIVGFPDEDLTSFQFTYHLGKSVWEFELSREALAQVASGAVTRLTFYICANPVCGYRSSRERERCPRCNLETGAALDGPHAGRVAGFCPYCDGLLRSLSAQQCRHCLMDWHDAANPVRMGAAGREEAG